MKQKLKAIMTLAFINLAFINCWNTKSREPTEDAFEKIK